MPDKKKKKDNTPPQEETVVNETETETTEEATEEVVEEEVEVVEEKKEPTESERYMRLYAEYENFRKRSRQEREALYTDIKIQTVKSFLPVYDNLLRALNTATEDEKYRKGVEMTFNQMVKTFEGLGVTEIECEGQTFDPSLHEAVMHEDNPEKGENEITAVFEKGFKIGDKVIRFPKVKVAN